MRRTAPDYYCTWLGQGRKWAKEHFPFDNPIDAWCVGAPDMLDSHELFGADGWANVMPEDLRSNLIFLIDSGWDVPYGTPNAQDMMFGSLIPDEGRFPEVAELSNQEKLNWLVAEFLKRGWEGVGIWVPAHECGQLLEGEEQIAFWSEKLLASKEAGIAYWKVDWGRRMYDASFRKMLTDLAAELYPELWVEHALVPPGHLNDGKGDGYFKDERCLQSAEGQLTFTDVFRTYDCTWTVGNSVTMARAAEMMKLTVGKTCTGSCLLNLESCPTLAIGLGGTFGSMAVPASQTLPEELAVADDSMDNARVGYDELRQAIHFRRYASPYAVGIKDVDNNISENWLTDTIELPAIYGPDSGMVKIMVPSAIGRGVALPRVTDIGNGVPMVAATRYPENVYAIASLPRAIDGAIRLPKADVAVQLPDMPQKIAVFGDFNALTLTWAEGQNRQFSIRSLNTPEKILGTVTSCAGTMELAGMQTPVLLEG